MNSDAVWDAARRERIGLAEAVFCEGKTTEQIVGICHEAVDGDHPILLTRLEKDAFDALPQALQSKLDYEEISRTGVLGALPATDHAARIAVITAGTSDKGVAREAVRTLAVYGEACTEIVDVGVAGLWRLLDRIEEIKLHPIVIMVAGMDGAIFSVLGGQVPGAVIAVPTSTGYGVSNKGETALHSALASCAPGVLATNIDNGYGAACAALRILKSQSSE
ncbi:MAG: nickel pincer cofactor biosynthesis protein LarB [Rhodospirillales bacterium]|jgi:pyridinium-3,5-biscarboxylic acid mononucleotide synthase|nr:nickel pincer cofactor biosynthesis protein LarB [Rhodospirillales bacterium]